MPLTVTPNRGDRLERARVAPAALQVVDDVLRDIGPVGPVLRLRSESVVGWR